MASTRLSRFVLSIALVGVLSQLCQAGFVAGFKGNSIFGTGSVDPEGNQAADGTVSFAVYETEDADWTDDFGFATGDVFEGLAPGPTIQTAAKFVYFFQIVNSDPVTGTGLGAESDLDSFFVNFAALATSLVSGGGYIAGVTFNDGADISSSNPGLGPDDGSLGGDPDSPVGNGVPSALFAGTPTIAPPGLGTLEASDGVTYDGFRIEFIFNQIGGSSIAPGARSTVLYLTSDYPPYWSTGRLDDGGQTRGDIPVPNPEPSSVVMAIGILICGLIAGKAAVAGKNA